MAKTYNVKLYGETYKVFLYADRYANNDRLAILLIDEDGEDFGDLTVNLVREHCPEGCAFVDTNNCPWAEEFINKNHLGEFLGTYGYSGYCSYPLYKFDMKKIGGNVVESLSKRIGKSKKVIALSRKIKNRNEKSLAEEYIFHAGYAHHGTFLFDDGTFGFIGDPEFDIEEFIDDPDYEEHEDDSPEEWERYLRSQFEGKYPIGNIYIDRWSLDGEFYQGGCYIYYDGESLKDYCDRNGVPYPVRRIPEEVVDALENQDESAIRELSKSVPELRNFEGFQ